MANVPPRSRQAVIDHLAQVCANQQNKLIGAGRALHDNVGPLLSGAGLQLQLLRMDMPETVTRVHEVVGVLDQAMDHVRALSQALNPSPVYRGGLKFALIHLGEKYGVSANVDVTYSAEAVLSPEIAAAIYEAADAVLAECVGSGADNVWVSITGKKAIQIRISDDGKKTGRVGALQMVRLMALAAGLALEISTGKSTIVSIRYAPGRSTRR